MITILLTSLEEYLSSKKELRNGTLEQKTLEQSKARVQKALDEYINYQISKCNLENRKKMSSARLEMASTLSDSLKENTLSVRAVGSLNSAPRPLSEKDQADPKKLKMWMEAYSKWFEGDRVKGMNM